MVLTVGDGGPGGGRDDAPVSTARAANAGIGLFVVRMAVDNHGGTITVGRSRLGGAEFRVVLPHGFDHRSGFVEPDA